MGLVNYRLAMCRATKIRDIGDLDGYRSWLCRSLFACACLLVCVLMCVCVMQATVSGPLISVVSHSRIASVSLCACCRCLCIAFQTSICSNTISSLISSGVGGAQCKRGPGRRCVGCRRCLACNSLSVSLFLFLLVSVVFTALLQAKVSTADLTAHVIALFSHTRDILFALCSAPAHGEIRSVAARELGALVSRIEVCVSLCASLCVSVPLIV